jgi:ribosomal protein S18 acetylase RimI-like enzyme
METTEVAAAAERNMVAALRAWAGAAEGGAVEVGEGCVFASCAVAMRSFNNVLVTGDEAEPARIVERARRCFAATQGKYRLRVREEVGPADDDAFAAHGLQRQGGIPCLAIALPVEARDAGELRIARVDDEATLADHVRVVDEGFDWDARDLGRVFRRGLFEQPRWRGYVGYVDGEPAGSSQLVVNDSGWAGIYYVATVEKMRRRGVGEAMTRHALVEASGLGCQGASLQASPMGRPVYERMGFKVVAEYRTYVPR